MNQRVARLIRKFAETHKLNLKAVKQSYYSTPSSQRHQFLSKLQVTLPHAPQSA